jgi:5-methylcytosine-specific restriction enzyme A
VSFAQNQHLNLISNHVKLIYDDKWDDEGIMHYTGMGAEGDQTLDFAQNKTLAESYTNGR